MSLTRPVGDSREEAQMDYQLGAFPRFKVPEMQDAKMVMPLLDRATHQLALQKPQRTAACDRFILSYSRLR